MIEFYGVRKLAVKISTSMLEAIAKYLIRESTRDSYFYKMRSGPDNMLHVDFIVKLLVQPFMQRNRITVRRQTRKLHIFPDTREMIERRVAFVLGMVSRALQSGQFKDEGIENADETHLIINFEID